MLEPADLLLLDEPTNDLDIPTLEVLEESLLEFPGALVLVTHDRYLLDRVSTRILALDGQGGAVPYADYDQWDEGRRLAAAEAERPAARPRPPAAKPTTGAPDGKPRKLGYLEQREWDEMEARILEAEERLEACREAAADPAVAADHQALAARIEALYRGPGRGRPPLRALGRARRRKRGADADEPGCHPTLPFRRDRRLPALVLVRRRALRAAAGERVPLAGVERGGVPGPVRDRHPPRVRPLARLPAGGRQRREDRPLAAGGRRLRRPAATSRRHPVEHRGRASRQRRPRSRALRPDADRPLRGPRRDVAGRGGLAGGGGAINVGPPRLQPAARLPARRRPDPAVAALVRAGAGPQPHRGERHRVRGRAGRSWPSPSGSETRGSGSWPCSSP